ncbi:IclR family transcriptional regulator [Agrobacterium tumefaciens]|uniref:IclR family transcriptional regulator n=1 Tax=Agrobacterium tumefaciens TaxID=358 RepID=UPI002242CE5B|nr:IclR family transcriptional regulator [Agrobacterium tumefaciens]MCW8146000.1 IclR family transcriptional regulator [Agrobacterium tumefaciens]
MTEGVKSGENSYRIEAVDCAIDVLQAIANEQGLSMADIARRVGGSRQRVFRMVKTLEARNLIERGRDGKSYQIGFATLLLGAAARSQFGLVQIAEPIMRELGQALQETVQLRIRDGNESLCVARWEPDRAIRVHSEVGQRGNFFGGSSKIFLAYMPEDELRPFLATPIPRYTANSIGDAATLLERLAEIRATGFSISRGEVNDELVSISAPVFSSTQKVVAVLNLAAPASRMPQDKAMETAPQVLAAAERISKLTRFTNLINGNEKAAGAAEGGITTGNAA